MFKVKDEVRIKPEFINFYKEMGLSGIEQRDSFSCSKVGRIIVVQENMAQVDFWSSTPVKFTIKMEHLDMFNKYDTVEVVEDIIEEDGIFAGMAKKKAPTEEHLSRAGILTSIPISKVYNEPNVTPEFYKNHVDEPKKYNDNKPMMSLIRPEFQLDLAKALTYGYTKYDEKRGDIQNYLKGEGFHYSTILDSLERHLNAFKSGVKIDEESGMQHLALAAANLMFLHAYENSDKGIDDRVLLEDLSV